MSKSPNTCAYVDANGKQCSNKCGIYIKYCKVHTELIQNVQVKKSLIPNSGFGLFAGPRGFAKGEKVAWYGKKETAIHVNKINKKCAEDKDADRCWEYVLCDKNKCWDGRDKKSTIARYANDCHGSKFRCNAQFEMINGTPWIVATRKIYPGDEIYCSYGKGYWEGK